LEVKLGRCQFGINFEVAVLPSKGCGDAATREKNMVRLLGNPKFLAVYSGVLTAVFVITLTMGFGTAAARPKQKFAEIEVQRINVVEPDGTLRMVISNRTSAPGIIIKGKEHPHPGRSAAGLIFFNDEGTENGGLIFGGAQSKDGKKSSYGHLSFDRYEQDQVFSIDAEEDGGDRNVALRILDRPDYSIEELVALLDKTKSESAESREGKIAAFVKEHGAGHQRLSLARDGDGSVQLAMKDSQGRERLVLGVSADGAPRVRLLDENGKVTGELPAAK
jgi:hypothetical protein